MKLEIRADWQETIRPAVERVIAERIASRVFEKDSTVWGSAAQPEAANRLGWVGAHETSTTLLASLEPLRAAWLARGVKRVVLCGMGGSSLAPEVMAKRLQLPVTILDATSPDQVAAAFGSLTETAVVVASKSGSTVETDSHRRLALHLFQDAGLVAQERMLIITDPSSPLDDWARGEGFSVINADPAVGGRYSALTAFGLAPIALAGGELGALVADTDAAASRLRQDSLGNPAIWLAALLASVQSDFQPRGHHRDKVLLATIDLPGLPDWVEQLVAESTGKDGIGTLPIAVSHGDEDLNRELPDTLRISLAEAEPSGLAATGSDAHIVGPLGAQFLLWEVATAILGYLLGINPFDQPDVESAKQAARGALSAASQLPEPTVVDRDCAIRSKNLGSHSTLLAALDALAAALTKDGYLALLTFASRPENSRLASLRASFAMRIGRPVSFGWGPRYLHSTGQYHKGGPEQGGFLQIRISSDFDLAVPGQPYSFGDLLRAQADGDAEVLAKRGRPVLILEFPDAHTAEQQLRSYCEGGAS